MLIYGHREHSRFRPQGAPQESTGGGPPRAKKAGKRTAIGAAAGSSGCLGGFVGGGIISLKLRAPPTEATVATPFAQNSLPGSPPLPSVLLHRFSLSKRKKCMGIFSFFLVKHFRHGLFTFFLVVFLNSAC
jgi:hypothetical protein